VQRGPGRGPGVACRASYDICTTTTTSQYHRKARTSDDTLAWRPDKQATDGPNPVRQHESLSRPILAQANHPHNVLIHNGTARRSQSAAHASRVRAEPAGGQPARKAARTTREMSCGCRADVVQMCNGSIESMPSIELALRRRVLSGLPVPSLPPVSFRYRHDAGTVMMPVPSASL